MRSLAAGVAGVAAVFVAFAWLLSSGPISLSFLTPYVQAGLARLELPLRVEFTDTELTWGGWDKRLGLQITDVRLIDADDRVVATVPSLTVALGVRRLLEGVIVPTSLELRGPRLAFTWTGANEQMVIGAEGSSQLLVTLARELLAPGGAAAALGGLRSVQVTGARVTVVDSVRGLEWQAEDANILISPDDTGPAIRISADFRVDDRARGWSWEARNSRIDVARGASGPRITIQADLLLGGETVHVAARAAVDLAAGMARVEGQFTPVMPATLAAQLPILAAVAHLRLPIGGSVGIDLSLAEGVREVAFDLFGAEGSIGLPGVISGEYRVHQLLARGRLLADLRSVDLQELMLDLGGPMARAWGTILFEGDHPAIDLVAEINGFSVADVIRFWPPHLSPKGRQWIADRIPVGRVPQGVIQIRASAEEMGRKDLPPSAFRTRFDLRGASVAYLTGLPPVTDLGGSATIENGTIDVRLTAGRSGRLLLSDGRVRLTGVDHDDVAELALSFTANGPARDAMTLLNMPRLRFAERFGFDVASMAGETSARVGFRFPIYEHLEIEQVEFDATATLRRFQTRGVLGDRELTGGELELRIDKRGLTAVGTAAIGGVPAAMRWESRFGDAGPLSDRYRFQARVDDRARAALGYDKGDRLVGPIGATVHIDVGRDRRREIRADLDLTEARFALPEIYWTKEPGVAASLVLDLLQANAGAQPELSAFHLVAPDFDAEGRGDLEPGTGTLRRLVVDRLKHGETDIALTVQRGTDGGVSAQARGRSLDVRPFIEEHQRPDATTDLPRIELVAEVDSVIGIGPEAMRGVRADLDYRDGHFRRVTLDGVVGEGAALAYRLGPGEGGRDISLVSDDAGALLRWYGLYQHATGGRLELTARIDDSRAERPVKGRLTMKEFRVLNAPTLAQVLTIGSLPDFVRALRGEGIAFDSLEGDFTWSDDGVRIENARSYGSELGLTLRGRVNLVAQTSELNGTIVPAYTLNTALGHIPLLGNLLVGGGKGSGVFAITYKVTGPVSEPTIVVNPLSVLAPGFLRNLFLPAQQPDLGFLEQLERQRPDG
ncbi:MAG: DUF3971 domain-containing protein [Alphaproteobacteria bacterium]|nr:DUF3971 domain-containing protein [Alphaproteobacteria bacterium]